jgi:hypothetical protein
MNKLRAVLPIGHLIVPAIFAVAVMLLWNWLMPSLFGLTTISFWQALGILVLCRMLFGSFDSGHHWMHRHHGKHNIREKWQKMTPEERKEFINRRMEYFDRGGMDFDPFATDENTQKKHE